MYLAVKLGILVAFIAAAIGVTKIFRAERDLLVEFGIEKQRQLSAVLLMWLCVWVPIAAVVPFAGPFLVNPLPFGALLAIPAVAVLRKISFTLERSGTDRTKRAKEASDHALFIGYASAILAVADWGFGQLVGSLPSVTGGQL